MWPQITILSLAVFSLGCTVAKGKDALAAVIAFGINFWLMYEGGFWAPLGLVP